MNQKNSTLIPLLPLRGIVAYPTMSLGLDVGRPKSIDAVKEAMKENNIIVLVTQKEESTSQPKENDLYKIGTLAQITSIRELPNNTYRIFVKVDQRVKLTSILDKIDFSRVKIKVIEDELPEDLEIQALMRNLVTHLEEYSQSSKRLSKDLPSKAGETINPNELTYLVASELPIKVKQKQELLEITDVKVRLTKLIKYVQDEKELIHLEKKVAKQVKSNIERVQKEYFLREQMKAIQKELGNGLGGLSEFEELQKKINEKNLPEHIHEIIVDEVKRYEAMPAASHEKSSIRGYIDWILTLPWTEKTEETINLTLAEKVLNEDHYGLEKVKDRILEFLAVKELTNSMKGPILCLVGPPGVGKTSLARSIASSVNRNFVRVSLGGVRDESEIRGHRRTYVGAMPGRIIQGMKKAKSVNPLFLLDEIDKMSSDLRGDPSAAMLEVLDPEQNRNFSDHYIGEAYDLSQVMFIATANSLSTIPQPLLDRMEVIELSGYTEIEKVQIAINHLLPKQLNEHGLKKSNLSIKEEAIESIVRYYTLESGVRSLERVLAMLCRRVAKIIVSGERKRVAVSNKNLETLIGKRKYTHGKAEQENQVGLVTGLAYTSYGGDTLPIEVTTYPGKGRLNLTGQLGDVMKESAEAAYSYVRTKSSDLGIEADFFEKNEIHIHVPAGAIPKDGPSAGITMATALVSALTNRKVRWDVGMTGEITLRGRVLPIGGLKEKSLSAHRAGLTTVILPKDNEKDIDDIPPSVREELTFIPVSHVDEVLEIALVGDK